MAFNIDESIKEVWVCQLIDYDHFSGIIKLMTLFNSDMTMRYSDIEITKEDLMHQKAALSVISSSSEGDVIILSKNRTTGKYNVHSLQSIYNSIRVLNRGGYKDSSLKPIALQYNIEFIRDVKVTDDYHILAGDVLHELYLTAWGCVPKFVLSTENSKALFKKVSKYENGNIVYMVKVNGIPVCFIPVKKDSWVDKNLILYQEYRDTIEED